jgi:hypothetical protein
VPRPTLSSLLPLLALAAVAACAPKTVQTYVAPTNQTVDAAIEMSHGGEAQVIVVTNRSTVPVVVTGVQLISCENIKTRCDEGHRLKVSVGPGQRRTVMTVRPDNPNRGHGFRFNYTWTAEGTNPLATVTP